ncbi:hypothetical protein ACTFIU_003651 [Dictyostelium citrinum]
MKANNTETNKLENNSSGDDNNSKDTNKLEINRCGDSNSKDINKLENYNGDNRNNYLVELKLPFDITLAQFNKFLKFDYNTILGVEAIYVDKNTIKVSHSKYFNICKLLPLLGYNNNHIKEILNLNIDLVIESYKESLYIIYQLAMYHSMNTLSIFSGLILHAITNNLGRVGADHSMIYFGGGIIRRPDFYFVSMNTYNQIQPQQRVHPFRVPLIPEFVAEVRSPNENSVACRDKMIEYINNGIETCLLIDDIDGELIHFCATPNPGNPPLISNSIPILGLDHQPVGVNSITYQYNNYPANPGFYPQVTIPLAGVLKNYPLNFGIAPRS